MAPIIRCGNCGKEIGERKRCPHCGTEQVGQTPDDIFDAQAEMRVRHAESQGHGARAIMMLAAVIVVLMLAGSAMYFLAAQMPKSPEPTPAPAAAEGNSAAPANADAVAGSTAIAPDQVNPDNLNRPLVAGGSTAAPASGNSGPAEPVAEGELTEKQAVERVMALPEVKKWMARVERNAPKNHTMFKAEGVQMGRYLIHVYEDVNDGNGQGHTATFGWYEVDKKTGEAVKSEE